MFFDILYFSSIIYIHGVLPHPKTPVTRGGFTFLKRTKQNSNLNLHWSYPLVNDHIAIAGISLFLIGSIHRLNPGPPFSRQLCWLIPESRYDFASTPQQASPFSPTPFSHVAPGFCPCKAGSIHRNTPWKNHIPAWYVSWWFFHGDSW